MSIPYRYGIVPPDGYRTITLPSDVADRILTLRNESGDTWHEFGHDLIEAYESGAHNGDADGDVIDRDPDRELATADQIEGLRSDLLTEIPERTADELATGRIR